MTGNSHPPLASLLPSATSLSGGINGLSFLDAAGQTIDDLIAQLLEPLRYRDLTIELSHSHDIGQYRFTLLTEQPVALDLPAGLSLVFFPDSDPTAGSAVDVAFAYQWPIKGYAREFEIGGNPVQAAFDLFLHLAGITDEQLYQRLLNALAPSQNDYAWLMQKLAAWNGDFQAPTLSSGTEVAQIVDALKNVDADVYSAAFEAVLQDAGSFDLNATFGRLQLVFADVAGQIGLGDIEDLLLPQFSLTVESLSAAIDFPANVLKPLDGSATSRLTFTAGAVTYDTRTGFDVAVDESVAVSFTPSQIGKTGLTLAIDGCKLDLSPVYNIPEAVADMRPPDFMGVFFKSVIVGLPAKWFASHVPDGGAPLSLGIVGRNVLIGTGGVSGTIGLEVIEANTGKPKVMKTPHSGPEELQFVLGQQPSSGARKGFVLGFHAFDLTFKQSALVDCKIAGSLTIPRSDPETKIGIELFIDGDGDFEVTASDSTGFPITIPGVFIFHATSVSVGKKADKIFLSLTGDLDFSNNTILGDLIKKPIHLEKLLIHSDGSFEIEGGTVPLPESVAIKIGPAKIAITALHMGAHEQEHGGVLRKYRYIGFDGGISVNPGGIDARGDGITFYHTVDDDAAAGLLPHHYLGIKGIGLDLVIPASASKESAALLLHGYLALKDPVYQGSISFELPKAKIFGGASMMYDTSYPAWIVRADLELPKALPLGSTSLGLYSFSGLFGLRYVASKDAIVPPLAPDASWGDYYRAPQPQVGVWPQKFMTPKQTGGSKNPFSVGVGVGLCTLADGGKTFSSQLFLLVSLPNLLMLEGRADILAKKRVGPNDTPPYYAYLAISPESVELGAGVHYLIPKDSGTVLKLDAVFEAAFFFHNSSAWYVHFGTKAKPVTARILSMFDGYSYLMLSASGIEAGAGVHYDFSKSYGPIGVSAHAYLDLWAHVSFERFQAGGGIALGGSVDVRLFRFELYIELAAGLTVEVPKPFRVAGSVEICVTVKLIKTFHKCCTLDFVWDRDHSVDTSAVGVIAPPADSPSAVAVHMLSGSTYAVAFSTSDTFTSPPAIPLDSYIDVKLTKPVDPSAVAGRIGGITNPPVGSVEVMPPAYGTHVVEHDYTLNDARIEVLTGSGWKEYLPYKALSPGAVVDSQTAALLDGLPLGMWQKQEMGYSNIRFLALTPFSWMGPATGYVPEEMGLTAKSLYCVGRDREERCLQWQAPQSFATGIAYTGSHILYRVEGADVAAVATTHDRLAPVSLAIAPLGRATFRFLEPAVHCRIVAYSTAPSIVVHWQCRVSPQPPTVAANGSPLPWPELVFEDVGVPLVVPRAALASDIVYDDPAHPIERVVIETPGPDPQLLHSLEEEVAQRTQDLALAAAAGQPAIQAKIDSLKKDLQAAHDRACIHDPDPGASERAAEIASLQSELAAIDTQIAALQKSFDASCRLPILPDAVCVELAHEIDALQSQAKDLQGQISALQAKLNRIQSEIGDKQKAYGAGCVVAAGGPPVSPPAHPAVPAAAGTPASSPAQLAVPADASALISSPAQPAALAATSPAAASPAPSAASLPPAILATNVDTIRKAVTSVTPTEPPVMTAQDCQKLAAQIAAFEARAKALQEQIGALQKQNDAIALPAGWACATFVHEICWLSQTDHAYNQTIPGIDAIAADYAAMRAAAEGVIQPIWQPRQTYRIALTVCDTVTDRYNNLTLTPVPVPFYVHFRTEGPIGFFGDIPNPDFGIPANANNDDRIQAPERAIKFYVDDERSYPDPSGNLLYAKPLYYANVTLRLFFDRPYAYHFFADWPDVGLGARSYALDLAIKDPAEAAPVVLTSSTPQPPPDYEAAHVSEALLGTQDWIGDASPTIPPEIAAINALQSPLAPGESHSTACLVTGGDPIVPLSKSLKVTVHDLEPDKLYTAVVLNKDVDNSNTAEVGSYPFKTSHYRDFAEHIASLRLRDDDGSARLAVFEVDHLLALAAAEAAAVSAALAIVMRAPGPASAAFPDPFDRLIHEQLKLAPLAPPLSLEINFVANSVTNRVYGLWIRSPEPLFDPRLPAAETAGLMQLRQAGNPRADARFLFSKDACQAFVISDGGTLPAHNVSLAFANKIWNGQSYDTESAVSETFGRP